MLETLKFNQIQSLQEIAPDFAKLLAIANNLYQKYGFIFEEAKLENFMPTERPEDSDIGRDLSNKNSFDRLDENTPQIFQEYAFHLAAVTTQLRLLIENLHTGNIIALPLGSTKRSKSTRVYTQNDEDKASMDKNTFDAPVFSVQNRMPIYEYNQLRNFVASLAAKQSFDEKLPLSN